MSAMEDKIAEIKDQHDYDHRYDADKPVGTRIDDKVYIPSMNTGPKGVLKDYEDAKRRLEERWKDKAERDRALIEKETMTVSTIQEDEIQKQAQLLAQASSDDVDQMLAEIDRQYATQYEQLRMQELSLTDARMKSSVARKSEALPHTKASKEGKKVFGKLVELEKENLVEFVESEEPNVLIFIHIYQPQIRACARLSEIMSQLCKMYPYIKWSRMMEVDKRDFEEDALPILVAYKAGDVLQSHIKLVDEIGHNFDLDDVLEFLESQKYLKQSEAVLLDEEDVQD